MRQRKNVTKFIKRAYRDMGELKQYKRYTKTRLNIISNKVFLLKNELYPLQPKKKRGKRDQQLKTTYTKKKLKRILSLLFRIGGKIYRKKIKKKKINLKKQQEPFTQNLTLHRLFRKFYLNLKLKQFKLLYKKYKGNEKVIIQQLEKRVDMVLLRSGFVRSLYEARQIINHKHLLVNGKIASLPGYMINVGDIISFKEGSMKRKLLKRLKKGLISKKSRKRWTNRNFKFKRFQNYKRKRQKKKNKNKVRATGPNYLEISHSLLLISLIEEPKLTAIKYPFTLQPEKNIKFITLLKKYKRLR
ncbi:ribosomal protein S4 (mitochondrion) [Dictyostelium discoideum]|uniref:Small ribosomal subunit protein uS4m n=2 Tax=Dictyostelium discoideum TaxID=44689 RepID=RT04_DICDI|nr:ribosomal protein S4 [Dictyostelium discoideum]Q9XPI8.1 RecName: Full=Small ribosomal subunit protein uS4m; AltName: Full=Ribosomal protein S4, mitochondrial [Dictyostelium discoideum]BAA78088.1 ribosomal protein S4 [Dictyostelium discoideum]|eukprot:NP_050106.1 ribosomal protein S4 (mitochondrion) [Dictyostelium discoideum]